MWNRLVSAVLLLAVQTANAAGALTGSVHDAAGGPVVGLVAVLFPADETAWPDVEARGTARRAPVAGGKFEMTGVPTGSYKFMVVDESALLEWPSPATFSQLVKRRTFPLQLTGGPPTGIDVEVSGSGASAEMSRISMSATRVVRTGGDPLAPAGRGQLPGPPRPTAPGSISGRVIDADGRPVAGVEVRSVRRVTLNGVSTLANFGASTTTDADGRYRLANRAAGTDLVVAVIHSSAMPVAPTSPAGEAPAAANGQRLGSVATFYGNTPDEMAAAPVTVTTEEHSGTDIQLTRVPVFALIGAIAPAAVHVRPGTLLMLARIDGTSVPSPLDVQRVPLAADNTFRFDDLADGEYDLSFGGMDAWGKVRARVSGRDPDPIVIAPHAPMLIRGRVEFEGSTPPPTIPGNSPQFGVELAPAQTLIGSSFVRTPIQSDGTFAARGTGSGPFRLRGTVPAPWFQVAGFVGGVDTLDLALTAGPDADDAVVVFADHPNAFRVTVVDLQGQPVANVGVIVFHEDPRYWTTTSRRVQIGTTSPGGTCAFTGLPPGRYFAATSPEVTTPRTGLQALIQRLKPDATPFEMTTGQSGATQLSVKR
jgi:hypothetical protein